MTHLIHTSSYLRSALAYVEKTRFGGKTEDNREIWYCWLQMVFFARYNGENDKCLTHVGR
jgi:hypothetical protein